MMKRGMAMLLALMMMANLTACGSSEREKKPGSGTTARTESTAASAMPETTKARETEAATEAQTDAFADRENMDLGLFKVFYPENWKYDEENVKQTDTNGEIEFFDGEEKKESDHRVKIKIYEEDAYRYRYDLYASYGVNLKDLADGKLDKKTISGTEFTFIPNDNNGDLYTYRDEPSGLTCQVQLLGKTEPDDVVDELLEGIQLTLTDKGNTDAPWPWDGEPFQPKLAEQMVGSYTIVPAYIPFEESQGIMDIMHHKFFKMGDQIFHLLNNKLDTYEYGEGGLKYVSTMDLDTKYEYISAGSQGMLYLSQGIREVIGVKDGQQVLKTTVTGDLAMHPSGEWGISFWVASDTQKAANQGGTLTAEPWILTNLNKDDRQGPFSQIKDVEVTDSHIMVSGNKVPENRTIIVVYDLNGNELMVLGDVESGSPDTLGSITGMAETENGFVAIDGNMRKIQFWNKEGTHLGSIAVKDMFGTGYPWLEDMQLLDDGSLLVLLTQRREDRSSDELMFFQLTGF